MTELPEGAAPSLPEPGSELLRFQVPEIEDVEVYLVRLEDGTVVARTAAELGVSDGQGD